MSKRMRPNPYNAESSVEECVAILPLFGLSANIHLRWILDRLEKYIFNFGRTTKVALENIFPRYCILLELHATIVPINLGRHAMISFGLHSGSQECSGKIT